MQVHIEVVPPLTQAFDRRETGRLVIEKTMTAATLADVLNMLIQEYPKFGEYALDLNGGEPVCPHILVALNNDIITVRNNLSLVLHDGDVLQLLPEFVGG